ncbi:MAG: Do family serine endopeptidase [Halobacteria archaeon]|nr:Do family serine endopeptidase [Halobacteria archaeon]
MRINKFIVFIFQFVTVGLAAAFVILYLYPQFKSDVQQEQEQHIIEVKEAPLNNGIAPSPSTSSYADAVEKAAPAVVNIFTQKLVTERVHPLMEDPLFRHFFGNNQGNSRQRLESSLGSGVIISSEGYILTNNHVIEAADEIEVALRDGRTASANIVGTDPDTDLAILKIETSQLQSITLGHSKQLRVGDVVLAIGNPFGVGQTVTSGIVSATGRNMLGINTYENFIQTDAAINPGNSGGALITANGNLIGINTAIFSRSGGSQGIGFAIPIDLARDVMQQIIEHGEVIRGWLGVAIQNITEDLAQSFELESLDGVIISNIIRNGPADQAGLTRGDVITRINGAAVNNVRTALNLISQAKPGSTVKISGIRRGKKFEADVIVMQRPTQNQ